MKLQQWFWLAVSLALGMAGAAHAADTLAYGAPPAWVKPLDLPANPAPGSGAIQLLLQDVQTRYGEDYTEHYSDLAIKVLTPAGLNQIGTISDSWDPSTTQVTIHALQVIRGGKVIDALAPDSEAGGDPFIVLRRETNLNLAVLDGALTATKQLGGLQVGDIVRFRLTERTKDPVMHDMVQDIDEMNGPVIHAHLRLLWPARRDIKWRTTEGFGDPTLTKTADGTELVMDRTDVQPLIPAEGAPNRYQNLGQIEVSQFADWQSVSKLFWPLYQTAATLSANSPLKAQAATIKTANPTKLGQALAALKLVQEQVRYVALAMGEGGLVPANADVTWSRRFGDCKGKTTLLLALLNELGIEAQPALVNADGADGLDQRLPGALFFNHVILRATIDGKVYWLDGTRLGEGDTPDLSVPPFDWALPLSVAGARLERLVVAPVAQPLENRTIDIDLTGGKTATAPVHVAYALTGEVARAARLGIGAIDQSQLDKALIQELDSEFNDVHLDKASFTDASGVLTMVGDGHIDLTWYTDSGRPALQLGAAYGYDDPPDRKIGLDPQAPISMGFPIYYRRLTRVRLPASGAGFNMVGADSDLTAGQARITRSASLKDGLLTLDQSMRTLATEVAIAEARTAVAKFKAAPTDDMFLLRAPANFAPSAASLDKAVADNPNDATALIERGGTSSDTGRYADAVKDFDAAIRLQPDNARAWRARSLAKLRMNDQAGALADAEQGIKLDAQSEWGYYYRGLVRAGMRDYAAAIVDYTAGLKIQPASLDILRSRAAAYTQLKQPAQAAADYQAAILLTPDNADLRSSLMFALLPTGPDQKASLVNAIRTAFAGVTSYELINERGSLLLDGGDEAGGLKDLADAIAMDRTKTSAYATRARYFASHDRMPEAERDLAAMIAANPSADSYVIRGRVRQSTGDYAGAQADYDQALGKSANNSEARLRLASIARLRGDDAGALSQLTALTQADPGYVPAYSEQAKIYEERKDFGSQAAALEKVAVLNPVDSSTIYVLAQLYEQLGDYKAELAALDGALVRRPTDAELLSARCLLKAQRDLASDTALADCDAALKLRPNTALYLDSKGLAELRLGLNSQAVADYTAALAIEPILPESSFGRAIARRRLGDSSGAATDLAAATRAAPQIEQTFTEYGLAR